MVEYASGRLQGVLQSQPRYTSHFHRKALPPLSVKVHILFVTECPPTFCNAIMDPLSGVASVIAVVQLAQVIGGALKAYYTGAREARADINRLYTSITSLEAILTQAEIIVRSLHCDSLESIFLESSPLSLLRIELERVRLILNAPRIKGKLGYAIHSLRWPFKNKDVEKVVGVIERHKSTLSIHFGIELLDIHAKQSDILESIRDDIKQSQSDQEHQRILKWLGKSVPDPSQEHNAARDKHENGTGSWLVDSDELKSWATKKNSFLWLNGGAGSGKSLLCSTVIEHLKARCRLQRHSASAVVYWYFSFATKGTLNISNFLCSTVRDLCSKLLIIPDQVQDAWADANNGQQRPTTHGLLEMLHIVLKKFDEVYLVVDGLDEYPRSERELLLDLIQDLNSLDNMALHVLVSSRRDGDISRAIEEVAETTDSFREVQVQGARVNADIEKYLEERLKSRDFRRWGAEERRDIGSRLSSQADGM